jgi:hypothetical protein
MTYECKIPFQEVTFPYSDNQGPVSCAKTLKAYSMEDSFKASAFDAFLLANLRVIDKNMLH